MTTESGSNVLANNDKNEPICSSRFQCSWMAKTNFFLISVIYTVSPKWILSGSHQMSHLLNWRTALWLQRRPSKVIRYYLWTSSAPSRKASALTSTLSRETRSEFHWDQACWTRDGSLPDSHHSEPATENCAKPFYFRLLTTISCEEEYIMSSSMILV